MRVNVEERKGKVLSTFDVADFHAQRVGMRAAVSENTALISGHEAVIR